MGKRKRGGREVGRVRRREGREERKKEIKRKERICKILYTHLDDYVKVRVI